jgi:hypothetical protein
MRCRSALTGRSTDETGIGCSSHDEGNSMLERRQRPLTACPRKRRLTSAERLPPYVREGPVQELFARTSIASGPFAPGSETPNGTDQHPTDARADRADNHVSDQTEATTLEQHATEPTGNDPDHRERNEHINRHHFSPVRDGISSWRGAITHSADTAR